MSALRDIRLLIAKHLDVSPSIKSAVNNLMNALDLHIDENGLENTELIDSLLGELESAIINELEDDFDSESGSIIADPPIDDDDDLLLEDDDDTGRR